MTEQLEDKAEQFDLILRLTLRSSSLKGSEQNLTHLQDQRT